ncbi:hypothetical protein [Streptomyces noursei]|uniref:hypothetical protein n=1 Tax=Streptomyces noursei TaxID=1971 RepID=UPI001962635A|nr:hypothetical protein [Streptomyces noursei]QRX90603.1 hypothetical protein JNO44_06935 [Streptomyces noursei]
MPEAIEKVAWLRLDEGRLLAARTHGYRARATTRARPPHSHRPTPALVNPDGAPAPRLPSRGRCTTAVLVRSPTPS